MPLQQQDTSARIFGADDVFFDDDQTNGEDGFVNIEATMAVDNPNDRRPTAPIHTQHQQSSSTFNSFSRMQPSAPTLEEVYDASPSVLAPPLMPPDARTDDFNNAIAESPLPPPLLPPGVASDSQGSVPTSSDNDTSCAICLDRKKQIAFFCGHQVCVQCSPGIQNCHICRKPIQGRIQLYGD